LIELGHPLILCKLSQRHNTYLTAFFPVNSGLL
jgi:hypothetical protein